jgi:hypothetical protein
MTVLLRAHVVLGKDPPHLPCAAKREQVRGCTATMTVTEHSNKKSPPCQVQGGDGLLSAGLHGVFGKSLDRENDCALYERKRPYSSVRPTVNGCQGDFERAGKNLLSVRNQQQSAGDDLLKLGMISRLPRLTYFLEPSSRISDVCHQ